LGRYGKFLRHEQEVISLGEPPLVVNILALVVCLSGISFSIVAAKAQAHVKGKVLIPVTVLAPPLVLVLMPASR